jgi:DNA polymerase
MSMREIKQYIELYRLSGIADFFVGIAKKKPPQIPQAYITKQTPQPAQTKSNPLAVYCETCPYHKPNNRFVYWAATNKKVKALFIGNPLNMDENRYMNPFWGGAYGLKFAEMREKVLNIKRNDLYLTNITKCYIENSQSIDLKHCLQYIPKQIEEIQPKIILIWGVLAANALLEKKENITYYRQNQGTLRYMDIPIFVTENPINVLPMTKEQKRYVMDDLLAFKRAYQLV